MEAQIAQFTNRGMYQDTSISKASNEFAFYNYNIRITSIDSNTLLSVTNERLPKTINTSEVIKGTYLGHTVLNDYLVLFTKDTYDRIYKIEGKEDTFEVILLFEGNLGFTSDNVEYIEALPYYESEALQKVYWVDGKHECRFINIANTSKIEDANKVNFNPTVSNLPKGNITKTYDGNGMFPSGVIQYFISYYNKYGAETGIVWASDLQYITEYNRAESPDKTVNCSFTVALDNVDTSFEYIRLFSLYRTSYNGEVVAQLVKDVKINDNSSLSITDTNTNNEIIDPTSLFFLGGNSFIAETLAHKDNTLFLGGITAKEEIIPDEIKNIFLGEEAITVDEEGKHLSKFITFSHKTIGKVSEDIAEEFQLNSSEEKIKTFKYGELYRFGVQFQTNTGTWTAPIWIGDAICDIRPEIDEEGNIKVATAVFNPLAVIDTKIEKKYVNYRLLIANPTNADRTILAQGIVSPTVFKFDDRVHGEGAYAMSSWLMRPRNDTTAAEHLMGLGNKRYEKDGKTFWENLSTCEIQNSTNRPPIITRQEYQKGFILSFHYYEGVLYYSILLGNNPQNNVSKISNEDIEEIVGQEKSVSLDLEGAYSTNLKIVKEVLEDIKTQIESFDKNGIRYSIELDSSKANTLLNFFAMFNNPSTREEYIGVYKTMPDYKFSSGYFKVDNYGSVMKTPNNEIEYGCYNYVLSTYMNTDIDGYSTNFYVDSSVLTFHSPEIENNEALFTDTELSFNIVGLVEVDKFKSDISLSVATPYLNVNANVIKPDQHKNKPLINDDLFIDDKRYYIYLWHKNNSIVGQTANWDEPDKEYSYLKTKIIANKNLSLKSYYLNTFEESAGTWTAVNVKPVVFNADQVVTKVLNIGENTKYYQGNYEGIIAVTDKDKYKVFYKSNRLSTEPTYNEDEQVDPVSIKYKSTPHIVFSLGNNVLPYLKNNLEVSWKENFKAFYELNTLDENGISLPWLTENEGLFIHAYHQTYIETNRVNKPYFYLAELKKVIDYNTLYGGIDNNALEKLTWIPASKAYKVTEIIDTTFGDTYYQRWDCLKTYPFTREDKNSVIDITSFMVETHVNLLGRYDKHKELDDIINVEPSNFSQINEVYSQPDNFFSYNILDEKYQEVKHSTQVVYSLNKIPTSDIDTWASITLSSAFNLDGTKGKLNKIINLNDTLITFQDKAISTINFNNRTALSTEGGVPIEIANSGKVNGYSIIVDNIGCQNKDSICVTSSGVYFIDDINKTLFNFNKEGLSNISSKGLSTWFKNNLTGKERVHYDYLNHDVYITNANHCLNYNEGLQSFVSFFDYNNTKTMVNINNSSYLIDGESTLNLKELFKGDYTYNYLMQYKINPEPLADKIFTNIEYISDCYENDVDSPNSFGESAHTISPFNKLRVWNEYQEGITNNLTKKYPTFNKKFRIWRIDVPRDKTNKRIYK